jgi:REP element-mobilizing transposase RayT
MATPQRTATQGTFFLTTVCYNRRRIFQVTRNAELFLETLDHYRLHYELHAYVLMPDHVHLILTPRGKTVSQIMNLIKGGFSHSLASKLPVWQRGIPTISFRAPQTLRFGRITPIRTRLRATRGGRGALSVQLRKSWGPDGPIPGLNGNVAFG